MAFWPDKRRQIMQNLSSKPIVLKHQNNWVHEYSQIIRLLNRTLFENTMIFLHVITAKLRLPPISHTFNLKPWAWTLLMLNPWKRKTHLIRALFLAFIVDEKRHITYLRWGDLSYFFMRKLLQNRSFAGIVQTKEKNPQFLTCIWL